MKHYQTQHQSKRNREWAQLSPDNDNDFIDVHHYEMSNEDWHKLYRDVHSHTFYQILWLHEGKGQHEINYVAHDILPNEIVFLSPWQVHRNIVEDNFKATLINFSKSFIDGMEPGIASYIHTVLFNPVRQQFYCSLSDECAEALRPITDDMIKEQEHMTHSNDEVGIIQQKLSLMQFILTFMRYNPFLPDINTNKEELALFKKFAVSVQENLNNRHNVQEYIAELDTSYYKLSQACMACTGKSPSDYIHDYIIEEGKTMLARTGLTIKEIAYDLGFKDMPVFSKFFVRYIGVSPSEFRKMHANV